MVYGRVAVFFKFLHSAYQIFFVKAKKVIFNFKKKTDFNYRIASLKATTSRTLYIKQKENKYFSS